MVELPRWALDEAKRMLHDKLSGHADQGVRLINELVEIPDDHGGVQAIAAALVNKQRRAPAPTATRGEGG